MYIGFMDSVFSFLPIGSIIKDLIYGLLQHSKKGGNPENSYSGHNEKFMESAIYFTVSDMKHAGQKRPHSLHT